MRGRRHALPATLSVIPRIRSNPGPIQRQRAIQRKKRLRKNYNIKK
jgi:hypothetical protein